MLHERSISGSFLHFRGGHRSRHRPEAGFKSRSPCNLHAVTSPIDSTAHLENAIHLGNRPFHAFFQRSSRNVFMISDTVEHIRCAEDRAPRRFPCFIGSPTVATGLLAEAELGGNPGYAEVCCRQTRTRDTINFISAFVAHTDTTRSLLLCACR